MPMLRDISEIYEVGRIYLSFIDPERGVFGEIFPEAMISTPGT